jgi:hypothetical protein
LYWYFYLFIYLTVDIENPEVVGKESADDYGEFLLTKHYPKRNIKSVVERRFFFFSPIVLFILDM